MIMIKCTFWLFVILHCIIICTLSQSGNTVTNPDGTCTNPIIWKFETEQEYDNFVATDSTKDTNNIAIRYNISTKNNAFCLDGTNGVFYFRPGFSTGITKYILFMEGGGSCLDIHSCKNRAKNYLGSTINDTKYAWFSSEFLTSNSEQNPLIYNWNAIFLRYCDGASFSGNNDTTTEQLYFRGYHILSNAMEYISSSLGLANATDIILSGCSAGGEATYYHADYIGNTFVPKNANYMAMPESGFFMEITKPPDTWSNYFYLHNMTISMNKDCIKQYNYSDYYLCAYAQYTMPYLKSKTFALQSRFDYDALQDMNFLDNNISMINDWGNNVTETFLDSFINKGEYHMNHAAYFDSCMHHCGEFNHIVIDGYVSSLAVYEWYLYGDKNHSRLWFQNQTYPCAKCCFPPNDQTISPQCVDPHN